MSTSVNCIQQVFSLFADVRTVQRFAVRSANCSTDGEASDDSKRSPRRWLVQVQVTAQIANDVQNA